MRTRIVGLALVAASVALVLFGIPLAFGVGQYALAEERTSLQRLADITAVSVYDDVDHDRVPRRLPQDPKDAADVALYDDDGDRIIGDGPVRGDDPVEKVLDRGIAAAPPDDLIAVAPVSDGDDVLAVVRVASSPPAVAAGLVPLWLGMLALAGLVLLAVWFLADRLARRLSRPLEHLAVDAGRLGEGDFGVRPVPSGMSEVDRVGTALGGTAERLDDLLARERAFSAEASHQLRTPLAGLRLRLEAVLENPGRLTRATVEDGLASIDRLERTIDELLLLSRERRHGAVAVDLQRLLKEAEDEWSDRLARDGRSFGTSRSAGLPDPPASAAAVRQIVGVLLDNASQHGCGAVALTAREAGPDAVALDVSDEGAGIDDTALAGPRTGPGLGVALARRLAEAEGGRLTARRSPSVVTLLLPLEPLEPHEPATEQGTS
ncbi:HAMP domain-containing sensor histidine kinase [Pseudonocardia nematodicida]|uniref:Signal transduction histidine-protein kinase/phosphatase MprB n=1 Tax=Pseudonocardia nematodicida TaxID=1206997 RepID=A0ABV1KFS3_9PSEU